jgi:acyl-CoA synthetase (AMP-forming)/AMP-acid ligase II
MKRGLHIDASFRQRLGLEVDEGVNMYGMTETCTAFTCGAYAESRQVRETTHGRPFPGSEIRIAGLGTGSPARTGEAGEICVRGYNLMRGYTDGSASDRIDEDGFFHTGDIGYLAADGYLHFVGRQKTLIKLKGLTVQPEEVEATLLRHGDVVKAVVLGRGDGHESEGLVALVVLEHGSPESVPSIEAYARQELSSYKVPQIIVVDDAKFPLSASLKIDRVAAAALLRELNPG